MVPGLISGRVLDAEGNAVPGARVFLVGGPTSFADVSLLTDNSGSFLLSTPSSGTYQVQTVADGFIPQTATFDVAEEQAAPRDIILERA